MMAKAFPLVQSVRLTIACTTAARSGVLWSAPAAPISVHGAGSQFADALVVCREETLNDEDVNVEAFPVSSALNVR